MTDDIQENKTLLKQSQAEKRQVALLVKQAELLNKQAEYTNRMAEDLLRRMEDATDRAVIAASQMENATEKYVHNLLKNWEQGNWWENLKQIFAPLAVLGVLIALFVWLLRVMIFGSSIPSVNIHIPEIQLKIAQESENPVLELPQVAIPMAEPLEPPERTEKTEELEVVPPAEAEAPDTATIMKKELQ